MKKRSIRCLSMLCGCLFFINNGTAQNPLILDQFTADPSAREFGGRVYVYPSHDEHCGTDWFCMKDYHVFSSENLTDWTDHGVIVSQENVQWVDSTTNSMWAPDCIEKDGKYYFYFPAISKDKTDGRRGMRIGVAVSGTPYGPFIPEPEPIPDVRGIDPNPFIDKDGQAYLYWAGNKRLYGARLRDNMLELASEPEEIRDLPDGFKEGPYLFERNGIYYLTYPHVPETTERLEYAVGDNPMGPFRTAGVIMDESPAGCWTNHHSIIEYRGQWYLFYHHNDLSPDFDKNRSIRADSLFFNEDGTIRKVIPTLRGVGLTDAGREIQIDRYSALGETGASIAFIDEEDRFKGWKTRLENEGAWIRYNSVDFGDADLQSVVVKAVSGKGGTVTLQLDDLDGLVIAQVEIPETTDWTESHTGLSRIPSGVHNLVIVLHDSGPVEIDWIRFE
ncbi:MAG TPA: carbohydrate-binding protein [bacterium]|nr:carbohydrate-binding protein [bacterium]